MATTTNYGWTTPDDTALVKDGAAAIRTLGSSIDSTLKAQIDAQIPDSIIDAKGDLIVGTADNTPARLASSGSNGQVLMVDTSTASGLKWATAPTAITFNFRTLLNGSLVRTIEYNGSNLYVAAGNAGNLYTSPDGITWTSRTSGFGANAIYKVSYGNGLWVAVGVNGTITTSTDGITWTARTANMSTNTIYDVKYANSVWVAVGGGGGTTNTGGITYSTDGITWTRKSQSLTVGGTYQCVVWNGTNWIVGATVSTNNYLYASAPSGTWTVGANGSGNAVDNIYWDGTRNIVISGSSLYYSTSTTLGTVTNLNGAAPSSDFARNYYYNGNLYVSGNTIIAYSTTPGAGNYVTTSIAPILSPTYNPDNANPGAIWVGAAGYITASSAAGQIFTSF